MHDEGIAFVDGGFGRRRRRLREDILQVDRLLGGQRRRLTLAAGPADGGILRLKDRSAVDVHHFADDVRLHLVSAVGEHRIGRRHVDGRHRHGAAADGELGVAGK